MGVKAEVASPGSGDGIRRVDSHMMEVYERIQNLQERDKGVPSAEQHCETCGGKAPMAAAAEAVAAVVPYSTELLKDPLPARCRISFRVTVMGTIVAAVLFACVGMFLPFQVITSEIHEELLGTLNNSTEMQEGLISDLVEANMTKAFQDVLNTLEQMVEHCVKEPSVNAVQDMWNTMQGYNQFLPNWGSGTSSDDRTKLSIRSWVGLSDRANFSCKYGFDTPSQWEARQIKGSYTAQISLGFAAGQYMSMVLEHVDHSSLLRLTLEDGAPDGTSGTAVTGWNMDFGTGKRHEPALGTYTTNVSQKAWYKVQSELAKANNYAGALQPAWSPIFGMPAAQIPWSAGDDHLGLAWTWPIAYCGNYSCFKGVIAFKVALAYVDAACDDLFGSLTNMLGKNFGNRIGKENSSVFIVNRRSRDRTQQGLLLGMSSENLWDPTHRELMHAEESSQAIVREASRALLRRAGCSAGPCSAAGSWDDAALAQLGHFSFRRSAIQSNRLVECESWDMRAHDDDCQQVAAVSLSLDAETSWLLVVTLPAGVLTRQAADITKHVNEMRETTKAEVERKVHDMLIYAIMVFVTTALVASMLGLALGWFITRPLQRLGRLMRRLGDLDFAHDTAEFERLRSGRQSWIKEVGKLQQAFCLLSRGIEVFARFVPEAVVRNIVRGEAWATRLHVTSRIVTIMFSDIRDFTSISEKLSQRDLLFVITRYLSVMTRVVELFDGVVSEVQGDGLLVLWNTPDDVQDHAARACAAALAQQQALRLLNEDFAMQGLPSLAIRIGLHTGEVMTGNLGSFTKMRFGCLGDAINLASRLEGLCKFYGVGVICSGATRELLPSSFLCRKLDLVQVKGRKEPTWIHEVVALDCNAEPELEGNAGGSLPLDAAEAGRSGPMAAPFQVAREAVSTCEGMSREKILWWLPWRFVKGQRTKTTSTMKSMTSSVSYVEPDTGDLKFTAGLPQAVTTTPHKCGDTCGSGRASRCGSWSSGCSGVCCRHCSGSSSRARQGTRCGSLREERTRVRLYEEALTAYQEARFPAALSLVDEFLVQVPGDSAALGLRERACRYVGPDGKQVGSLSEEELSSWSGVLVMTEK